MKTAWWASAICGVTLAVHAQTLPLPQRDPTLPPASVGAAASGDAAAGGGLPLQLNGSNVVVRDGKPFLVVGSRLVAPGQTVESYRLERITETEIWLRDANGLTKVPRFAGIQRQLAKPAQCPATSTVAPASRKKPARKPAPGPRSKAHPHSSKTGAGAPRPIRENEAHDC